MLKNPNVIAVKNSSQCPPRTSSCSRCRLSRPRRGWLRRVQRSRRDHRRYADLQIDLTGGEYLGWASEGKDEGAFDETADCGFKSAPEHCGMTLGDGRFAIFFPGELHKPSCKTPDCTHVRKAIVKILMK